VDSTIFINWMSARKDRLSLKAALSGYALMKIRDGMRAYTTTLVKDEVLIWLSRYGSSRLKNFMTSLRALASLQIVREVSTWH